jgi:hypothetical protein
MGLFSLVALEAGAILWCFEPGLEQRHLLRDLPPGKRTQLLHYGYINPRHPEWLVICGDAARYWNFPPPGETPNTRLGSMLCAGEAVAVAARAIAPGEELLIEAASDADYHRKMGLRSRQGGEGEAALQSRLPLLQPVVGEPVGRKP